MAERPTDTSPPAAGAQDDEASGVFAFPGGPVDPSTLAPEALRPEDVQALTSAPPGPAAPHVGSATGPFIDPGFLPSAQAARASVYFTHGLLELTSPNGHSCFILAEAIVSAVTEEDGLTPHGLTTVIAYGGGTGELRCKQCPEDVLEARQLAFAILQNTGGIDLPVRLPLTRAAVSAYLAQLEAQALAQEAANAPEL